MRTTAQRATGVSGLPSRGWGDRRAPSHGSAKAGIGIHSRILSGVRRNTVVALIFLLVAITIAGVLGVIRLYQLAG